jgi:hypothetical protein
VTDLPASERTVDSRRADSRGVISPVVTKQERW